MGFSSVETVSRGVAVTARLRVVFLKGAVSWRKETAQGGSWYDPRAPEEGRTQERFAAFSVSPCGRRRRRMEARPDAAPA